MPSSWTVGDVGEALGTLAGEHRQQAQLAGLHHRRPARGFRGEVDLAAEQRAQGVGGAAVGCVRPAQALQQADPLHRQLLRRADAERAVVQLARVGLGVGEQLGQRLPRRIGAHHDAHDVAGDLQDVGEVGDRVVGQRLVEQRLAQHAHMHLRDHVAVRLLVLQRYRAQHARGAGLVLDHDRLAEFLRRRLRHDAEAGIGGPARAPRHDQLDRAFGKFRLGVGGKGQGRCADERRSPGNHQSISLTFT